MGTLATLQAELVRRLGLSPPLLSLHLPSHTMPRFTFDKGLQEETVGECAVSVHLSGRDDPHREVLPTVQIGSPWLLIVSSDGTACYFRTTSALEETLVGKWRVASGLLPVGAETVEISSPMGGHLSVERAANIYLAVLSVGTAYEVTFRGFDGRLIRPDSNDPRAMP